MVIVFTLNLFPTGLPPLGSLNTSSLALAQGQAQPVKPEEATPQAPSNIQQSEPKVIPATIPDATSERKSAELSDPEQVVDSPKPAEIVPQNEGASQHKDSAADQSKSSSARNQDLVIQSTSPRPHAPPLRGTVMMNFDDADVYAIIQTIFGDVLKSSYVVDPRIKGRVTFRATSPVPVANVLALMEIILRLNGIGIVEEKNLYRIVPLADISKEPSPISYGRDPSDISSKGISLVHVAPVLNIPSSDAAKLLKPFASNDAVLIDVPKGNQIILVDTDANVKRLLQMLQIFDSEKMQQIKPQIVVYPVQNGKAAEIANLLQQIFLGGKAAVPSRAFESSQKSRIVSDNSPASSRTTPESPGAAQNQISLEYASGDKIVSDFTKIIPDETTNTVSILATPEDQTLIMRAIEKIDIEPRQVVIEGMIAAVTLTDELTLGVGALFKGNIGDYALKYGFNTKSFVGIETDKLVGTGFTFVATDPSGIVRSFIEALAQDSKAKLLAVPHILVSDNKEAKIQVGQQVPLVTSETYGGVGVLPQRNIEYRDIGIILKVKPRVNESGLVSLEIYQEVSRYSTKDPENLESEIILEKQDVQTDLVVKDGHTIIIGGLIRDDTNLSRSGVPWLYKIPILGWLLGYSEDTKSRQELVILLTPHVITNQAQAKEITSEYIDNITERSEGRITKEELLKQKPKQNN